MLATLSASTGLAVWADQASRPGRCTGHVGQNAEISVHRGYLDMGSRGNIVVAVPTAGATFPLAAPWSAAPVERRGDEFLEPLSHVDVEGTRLVRVQALYTKGVSAEVCLPAVPYDP